MAEVAVTINGRSYKIACDDGQEGHLRKLASYLDKRTGELVSAMGQVGDSRLLVMVGLLVVDELWDAINEIEQLRAGPGRDDGIQESLANSFEVLAKRIEHIATQLGHA